MDPTLQDLLNRAMAAELMSEFLQAVQNLWNYCHGLIPGFPAWDFTGLSLPESKTLVQNQVNTYFPSQGDGDQKG